LLCLAGQRQYCDDFRSLPGPGLVRVGEENQPVTTTPTFHWLNISSDSYQLQVALSTFSAIKDDEPMATGDFEHPLIDVKNITDTFFVSPYNN